MRQRPQKTSTFSEGGVHFPLARTHIYNLDSVWKNRKDLADLHHGEIRDEWRNSPLNIIQCFCDNGAFKTLQNGLFNKVFCRDCESTLKMTKGCFPNRSSAINNEIRADRQSVLPEA